MAKRKDIFPVARDPSARKPKIKLPDGYASEGAFLEEMRKLFADDIGADKLNRDAALEDLKFMVGDQWDDATRQRREAARKPVLTINRIPAFVAQVLGSRRLNETEIKVRPDNGGTKEVAAVREGLIRNIQKVSNAKDAYDNALAGAVICGIGNFQVMLEYESEDVWDQKISIAKIADHMSVVWDRHLTDSTGRDAKHCFVVDTLSKEEFYRLYPWAQPADMGVDAATVRGDLRMSGWISVDDVRVVNYWRMRTRRRVLALFTDGSTREITEQTPDEDLANIVEDAEGRPIIREVDSKYAQLYICSGLDILEGPYNLNISRIPVFRVPGWEIRVGDNKQRWGLVRFLKDPQRLHNYWRSTIAEKLMQTPRAVWAAADTAVAGREMQWRNSHLSDDPLLIWNAESGQKPERVPPAQLEPALISEAATTSQDIKDVSNIHEANLGMPSNEVSGAAILARQRVSDTGTILYHDNLAAAIAEAGRVINELIPIVYDTPRVIKVMGTDSSEYMQVINQANNPESVDVTLGKYSITVEVGPSYNTKRIESAQNMLGLATAMPQVLSVAADLIVEAQDWPGSEKIAARIKNTLPPQILGPTEQTPQTMARLQAESEAQSQIAELAARKAIAEFMELQSKTVLNYAKAQAASAEATARPIETHTEAIKVATDAAIKADANDVAKLKAVKPKGA
jgi:hypothetical protein